MTISAFRVRLCHTAALPLALAFAGQAAAAPDESPPSAEASMTTDIIVTARRTSERLQDVPVAVTAVSPAQVKALNLTDTRDLVRVAPMLGFTQGSTTKLLNFTVRGVGTFVNSDGFDQSVGVAFDGVSLARPGGSIADLIDIERVEVLEGPQGMLFGRNASAGLINIVSRKPELATRTFTGRFSYGSYKDFKAEVAANLPLGETVALRLAAWDSRHDGFVDNIRTRERVGEKNSQGVRMRTLWEPSDALRINLMGEYVHTDQDPAIATFRRFNTNLAGVRDHELGLGIKPGPKNNETSSDKIIFNRGYSGAVTGEVQYDIGGRAITLLAAYRKIRVNDRFDPVANSSPIYNMNQEDDLHYNQKSAELRLNSEPGAKLTYVVGAIYFGFDLANTYIQNSRGVTPAPISVIVDANQRSRHYAGFGEVTYPVLPSLRLIAGARISADKISGDLTRKYFNPPTVIIPAFNGPNATFGPYAAASTVKDDEWSYRFGAQWQVARDIMMYGTVSRGYKAAGLDLGFTITPVIFNVNRLRVAPEISKNYEVGLRTQFFDRKLTLNATAFHEIFSDFQIASRLPVDAVIFTIQNAKQLKSTGASISVDARPIEGLSFSGNLAYVDARYTDFTNASCYPGEPTAPVGTPKTPGLCIGGVQSLNGLPLQNAPKWRANMTARYETRAFADGLEAFGQVNLRHQSSEVFNAVADPLEKQGGYTVVNLSAGIGAEDGSWRLSAFGNNVFDRKFVARIVGGNQGASYVNVVPYDARARYGVALEFAL